MMMFFPICAIEAIHRNIKDIRDIRDLLSVALVVLVAVRETGFNNCTDRIFCFTAIIEYIGFWTVFLMF